ncbi:interferon-stimulated 20 kDa exonuclease-like 2 [Dendropsophus ebraccatus]|uniref:interferon-stimulated 20 kDa exonuclease-like 2 n=1 Tax=Dendropsophus ebraccatus TaxID=150705 RepID=UPI0038313405
MADLLVNLDFSSDPSRGQTGKRNKKHEQFLRKRKFLEKRGYLKQKQLPHKLPNRRPPPPHPGNTWDHNSQNGQVDSERGGHERTGRIYNNSFHQQGAPNTSSRAVTVGKPHQPGTLNVSINCAPGHPHLAPPSKGHSLPSTDGAKKPAKPFIQQPNLLSEYESCLPPVSAPSHKIVAIDCEMVGTGLKGRNSALARCSIVNYQGDVVYDKYIKPPCPVTDYRTRWSGIRREHLVNAVPFTVAQKEIQKLLHGKIVIGHAIQNDYKALGYFHPKEMTRDTSKIPLLNQRAGIPANQTASLKTLSKHVLHKEIQMGRSGHSSVEDAKATMELYRAVEADYEKELASGKVQP